MPKIIATLGGVSLLASGLLIAPQADAQNAGRKYVCHEPTNTVVVANESSIQPAIPLIQFTLNTAQKDGWDNLRRCRVVASKFDRAYREGRLKYALVTSLRIRPGVSLPVLCGLRSSAESCNRDSMLYTILNPNVTNPQSIIKEVFGIDRDATSPAVREDQNGTTKAVVYVGTNEQGEAFVEMEQVLLYKASQYTSTSYR
jgi:hypothetical protein